MHRPVLFLIFILTVSFKPAEKTAYHWFSSDGESAGYAELFESLEDADVILFGELHNNPVAHWFQLELLKDLNSKLDGEFALALEQLEADDQVILNEYFDGLIAARHFEREARLWPNYKTDIKPLIEFCRENEIPVIASNIPRRYAAMVAMNGLESLEDVSEEAKNWIAPLPVTVDLELPAYSRMLEGMGHHGHGTSNPEYFVYAQAVKDATMAHFILKYLQENRKPVLHINGAFHSNHYEGIYWYLKQELPDLNIVTISTAESADPTEWSEDYDGLADFILVVNERMAKTH